MPVNPVTPVSDSNVSDTATEIVPTSALNAIQAEEIKIFLLVAEND